MSTLVQLASLAGTVLLTSPFWWSSVSKILDFSAAKAEMQALGFRHPVLAAVATIVIQLGGSALVVSDQWAAVGAALLAVFTIAASGIGHPFWKARGQERAHDINAVLANLGLVGGLALSVILSQGTRL